MLSSKVEHPEQTPCVKDMTLRNGPEFLTDQQQQSPVSRALSESHSATRRSCHILYHNGWKNPSDCQQAFVTAEVPLPPKRHALAGNRTRVNCLEGSYAHHYTTNAGHSVAHAMRQDVV